MQQLNTPQPIAPDYRSQEFRRQETIAQSLGILCAPASYQALLHKTNHDTPMPSVEALNELMHNLRAILFPGYFGPSHLKPDNMMYYMGASLDQVFSILSEQIRRGFCFACITEECASREQCERRAFDLTESFVQQLVQIRHLLATDVHAAYEGDPAAKHPGEAIFCYPSIHALTNYRIAHELCKLDVPLIPRIITEMAHGVTGIDIHPGAQIGEHFFMDHGTGIVIGETSIIGKNVRVYQGVTLGAKSFPVDKDGRPIKGIIRHPIVEDDVIIYSGATILGRVTIGQGAVIGGNVWLTRDVPAGSRILQGRYQETLFERGAGI